MAFQRSSASRLIGQSKSSWAILEKASASWLAVYLCISKLIPSTGEFSTALNVVGWFPGVPISRLVQFLHSWQGGSNGILDGIVESEISDRKEV